MISHQDIWSSDYDRIFNNGWKWHTQGLNIRGNILSTGALYKSGSTRYYVLNWDISDNFKPTGYEVSKERGLKLSSNGNNKYRLGTDYNNPIIIFEDSTYRLLNNGPPIMNTGYNYGRTYNTTSFVKWAGGRDEIDVAIHNGYIYILDGDRILKSTTQIE